MLRALARFLGRRAGDRRQLRPRRLPDRDRAGRAGAGLARVFAGDYRVIELPTLEVTPNGDALRRGQRRRGRRAERSGASSSSGMRSAASSSACSAGTDRPRHAAGLDRLQPVERRARPGLGDRRDGGHLRRPALAARPAARRAPRPDARRHEPVKRRADPGDRRRPRRGEPWAPGITRTCGSVRRSPCSRPCPRSTFFRVRRDFRPRRRSPRGRGCSRRARRP